MSDPASLQAPGYPSAGGQQVPDLQLAEGIATDMTRLSPAMGGHPTDSTPPQRDGVATALPYDIGGMGISTGDSAIPYFDLGLAGANGFMTPSELTAPSPAEMRAPSYLLPDFNVPPLKPGDLVGPGIGLIPAFKPDPPLGDILAFDRPKGLDVMIDGEIGLADLLKPDPMAPDLGMYDRPDGLQMPGPLVVDPALPNLQSPELTQETHMAERPGELAEDALDALHDSADDASAKQSDYPEVQFDARGDNQARRRRMELIARGLDATGRG
jgi:hypothetical protein